MRCVVARFDAHDLGMAGITDGPRPSVDGTPSPTTFYTGAGTDTLPTQQTTGARRGSFLFRCESEERGDAPTSGMIVSNSTARLTSLAQANTLHEMLVSFISDNEYLYFTRTNPIATNGKENVTNLIK